MKLRYPKTREEFEAKAAKLYNKPTALEIKKVNTGHDASHRSLPLFRGHSDEVKKLAANNLEMLMVKYKHKLDNKTGRARNFYYGCLIGRAIAMAKFTLGLTKYNTKQQARRGLVGRRAKSHLRTELGLQQPIKDFGVGWEGARKRKLAAQNYNPNSTNGQVIQGDLTGI